VTDDGADAGWSEQQADCRLVFEENIHPMWISTMRGIVEVNRAALQHYHYSREEFLAMSAEDFEVTESLPAGSSPMDKSASPGGRVARVIGKHHKRDGSSIDVELTAFAISFGGVPAMLISVSDVTRIRKTEAQARYLDFLLARVTDAIPASDDVRLDFVDIEPAEAVLGLVNTGRFDGELAHRRGDGRCVHIESRAVASFDSFGTALGCVSVDRAVTRRRRAEETIRALLNEVIAIQEEERRRTACELDEETAQVLTSVLIGLRALEELEDLSGARGVARTLRASVSTALNGVKRLSRGLRPSVLDDLGLEEALDSLVDQVSRRSGVCVDLHATGPRVRRLPGVVEIALYRIAEEALVNMGKHAAARSVSVLIQRNARTVRLIIEDDGKGFDVAAAPSETQLGLMGMRERAHLVGGSMVVESGPGRGTSVCVSVPLPTPTTGSESRPS
jgi:PAS domain S-box-containing protein